MSSFAEKITLLAGIVRKGDPDKKQAIPVHRYVERHHVSKGRFLRSNRVGGENVTLTLIQVVIPRGHRYAYSTAIHKRFQFWIKACPSAELIEVSSIAHLLEYDLTADNKCPYVFSVCESAHSDLAVDAENTFGAQIVRRQLTLPVMWGYVNAKYTDQTTLTEITRYRELHAHEHRRLQWEQRVRSRQLMFREHVRRQVETRDATRRLSDILIRHRVGSDEPNTRSDSLVRAESPRAPVTASPGQRSISAHAEGSTRSATLVCFCCCEEKPMHALNCGHICCEACIEKNVKVTQKRFCYVCKAEWTFHRPVDASSVLPHVVCHVCDKPRVYVMICGHATCGCPNSVCSKCNTGATIRVFI